MRESPSEDTPPQPLALLRSLWIQGPLPSSEILQGTLNFLKTNGLHLVKAILQKVCSLIDLSVMLSPYLPVAPLEWKLGCGESLHIDSGAFGQAELP